MFDIFLEIPSLDEEPVSEKLFELGAGSVTVIPEDSGVLKLQVFCETREILERVKEKFPTLVVGEEELHESAWKNK